MLRCSKNGQTFRSGDSDGLLSQHQALDALAFGIGRRRINQVLDCDVQSFFDKVSQDWLIRFVERRIGDRRIIRLIAKWLTAGVLEDGRVKTEEGTPQGADISPLLTNIYLHHVYDQWVHQWRQRCATGDVIVVRYADDTIVGFEHRHEAEQFLADLKARLARFGLNLHSDNHGIYRDPRLTGSVVKAAPRDFPFSAYGDVAAPKALASDRFKGTSGPYVLPVFKLDGAGRQLENRCSLALRQERQ